MMQLQQAVLARNVIRSSWCAGRRPVQYDLTIADKRSSGWSHKPSTKSFLKRPRASIRDLNLHQGTALRFLHNFHLFTRQSSNVSNGQRLSHSSFSVRSLSTATVESEVSGPKADQPDSNTAYHDATEKTSSPEHVIQHIANEALKLQLDNQKWATRLVRDLETENLDSAPLRVLVIGERSVGKESLLKLLINPSNSSTDLEQFFTAAFKNKKICKISCGNSWEILDQSEKYWTVSCPNEILKNGLEVHVVPGKVLYRWREAAIV